MDVDPYDPGPEKGRVGWSEIQDAPHAVVGDVPDLESARLLIEDLEKHGVPPHSIGLLNTETKDPRHDDTESAVAESGAFTHLSRSVIVGGSIGIGLGGLFGLLMGYMIPDLSWFWGVIIGGLFGGAVGGAAGGMSVAKYSSPAWDETYQVEDDRIVKVAVHHAEADVVDEAEAVMNRHIDRAVERLDRPA